MNNKIEIHIITYNEEIMLPFTIAHYKRMFGKPKIIIHDNGSTDNTIKIATDANCEIIPFTTNGMNDTIQSKIKSHAAMNATAEWVLCIDADELCMIDNKDLNELNNRGVNIVHFEGWNIFDKVETPWDVKEPMGVFTIGYSKPILIKTSVFDNIDFAPGAHSVTLSPMSRANFSKNEFKLLHYKHWSCDWNIKRSKELAARQSQDNKTKGYSFHFSFSEERHKDFFNENFNNRVVIKDSKL